MFSVCKILGASTLRGRNIVSRKSRFGWVQTHMSNFLDSEPKSTGLISPNAGGIDLDQLAFRFWISWVFFEIFAIKVGSCVKSPQIFAWFWPPKFFRGEPPSFYTCIIKSVPILITVKVSRRSADGARRSSGEIKKHPLLGLPELTFRAA